MRIALIYGRFCSGGPGVFDIAKLYRAEGKGLTGSESFFFNTAKGLAERGHDVQVFCDCPDEVERADTLAGAQVLKLESAAKIRPDLDVALAWNEPDLLRPTPATALRVCVQQLNDFDYAGEGFRDLVDLFASPSETHRQFMVETCKLPPEKTIVMPNSINPELYEGAEPRRHHSVAYCSSPDRGLHWLLEWWPQIRKHVPDAELRIYYKVEPWIQSVRDGWVWQGGRDVGKPMETAFRARFIEDALRRLGRAGENGVHLVGPIPNAEIARELMRTEVFAYPCDTLRWSEGFSVAIMDACAAGAMPIISDCDAIGEVYDQVAHIIPGRPSSLDEQWIETICRALLDPAWCAPVIARARAFAAKASRQVRAEQWEALLLDALAERRAA